MHEEKKVKLSAVKMEAPHGEINFLLVKLNSNRRDTLKILNEPRFLSNESFTKNIECHTKNKVIYDFTNNLIQANNFCALLLGGV
jgi:hypothetical protein